MDSRHPATSTLKLTLAKPILCLVRELDQISYNLPILHDGSVVDLREARYKCQTAVARLNEEMLKRLRRSAAGPKER